MKIGQSRFLLLTGVLTASVGVAVMAGCTIKSGDAGEAPQEQDISAKPAAPEGEADGGKAAADGGPAKPGSSGGTSGTSGSSGSSGGGKDGGTSDSGKADSAAPAACLDDKSPAAQPACPTAGAGDECTGACDDYATNFKKGLSADIRGCLTKAICQAGTTKTCTDKALAKACADATATTFCTPMVTGCKGANPADTITQASCEGLAKGMTTAGRDALRNCFENEFVCGDCIDKLK